MIELIAVIAAVLLAGLSIYLQIPTQKRFQVINKTVSKENVIHRIWVDVLGEEND